MSEVTLESRLEELRTKRDALERKLREGRVVVSERLSTLGLGGPVGRDVPPNILAELRWLERDARKIKDLGIAIAALKRALEDGLGGGTYRESGDGMAAVIRRAQLQRDELKTSLQRKKERLLARYIAANVPMVDGTSKAGIALFVAIVVAAGAGSAALLGWPWCLVATWPIGVFVGAAVSELRQDRRAKKTPQSLVQFDSRKAPKELDAERNAMRVESERLDVLSEEVAVLERVFEEKEE